MARDLHELMSEALARGTGALADTADDADRVAAMRAAVRRRRTIRAAVRGASAACVAVVVGGAAWFGLRAVEHPTPAVTPSPSVTRPTPSPTPTATPSAAPEDQILGLPPTRALPPGLLERATAGWVLSVYRSVPASAGTEGGGVVHALVLSSPAGELYRVIDLPQDTSLSLLHWEAGSTTAAVTVHWAGAPDRGTVPRAELDLLTGAITARPITPPASVTDPAGWYYAGRAADGAELWTEPTSTDAATSNLYAVAADGTARALTDIGYAMWVNPTGARSITPVWGSDPDGTRFRAVDLSTGESREYEVAASGRTCEVVEWLGPDQVLLYCLDAAAWTDGVDDPVAADASFVRLDLVGATQVERVLDVGPTDPRPVGSAAAATPGVVAFVGTHAGLQDDWYCGDDVYLMTAAGGLTRLQSSPLTAVSTLSAQGGALTFARTEQCVSDSTAAALGAVDLDSRETTILAPPPPVTPQVPVWESGVVSWVVGD